MKKTIKKLDIVFFNLINDSECNFYILAIKIYFEKKIRKPYWPVLNFQKSIISAFMTAEQSFNLANVNNYDSVIVVLVS